MFSSIPIEFIVALTTAITALCFGLVKAYHIVVDARERVNKVLTTKAAQVERLRRAGRTSLMLKRNLRDAIRRRDATNVEVDEAESRLKIADAVDHRVFVLDDRRTKADQNWIADVNHPSYAQSVTHNALPEAVDSWKKGRRFLVYALDAQKARDKVASRYPERMGYRIQSVESQKK